MTIYTMLYFNKLYGILCYIYSTYSMLTWCFAMTAGETFRSLAYSWRVHQSTIRKIIPETCRALYDALQPLFMEVSRSKIFSKFINEKTGPYLTEVLSLWCNSVTESIMIDQVSTLILILINFVIPLPTGVGMGRLPSLAGRTRRPNEATCWNYLNHWNYWTIEAIELLQLLNYWTVQLLKKLLNCWNY